MLNGHCHKFAKLKPANHQNLAIYQNLKLIILVHAHVQYMTIHMYMQYYTVCLTLTFDSHE